MRPTELQLRLESEVMEVEFDAIRPHVEREAVVLVSRDVPLVKAAMAVALDSTQDVTEWMARGVVTKLSKGDCARFSASATFAFLIVQPFVLIQPAESVDGA